MYSFPAEAPWRTSSYTQQQNCVEVADAPGLSAVRDTKNRQQGHLAFASPEWRAFVAGVRQS
ncbi:MULTISPECIES: DUF397 domain-containing protein [unclassified Nocardiopsis]|uniref:DUF397 domain-containing protein n=1 Tax=unclassified Nocardiopsis TaxID=2649073 RepID=UPI0009E1EB67|nr:MULTISPECIES: DUF397 domain-containing protein [unclassified Nocardiopsis]MBQ1084140.1 DUF397 domain-containing protein [Nocardiopsis sp. B62]